MYIYKYVYRYVYIYIEICSMYVIAIYKISFNRESD